jgi:hypothetical protein
MKNNFFILLATAFGSLEKKPGPNVALAKFFSKSGFPINKTKTTVSLDETD